MSRINLDLSHPSLLNDNNEKDSALCHMISLFPFVVDKEAVVSGYESAFATYLAIRQLNQRDGSIVREVNDDLSDCNIQFSIEYLNTHYNAGRALNALMQRIVGNSNNRNMDMDTDSTPEVEEEEGDDQEDDSSSSQLLPQPCAFLGAYRSSISAPTATLTSFQGYPQISGMSTSSDLNDRLSFPLFGRTIPSDAGTAQVVAMHYASLGISHLAVLATNDSFGNAYASELRKAVSNLGFHLTIQQIPMEKDGSNIVQAITSLKQLQYRYIFVAHFGGSNMVQNDNLMLEAHRQNLIEDHVWMFSDGIASSLASKDLERNSPLHLAYRGVGSIEASGGLSSQNNDKYDAFAEQMIQLKQDFLQDDAHPLRALVPHYNDPDFESTLSFLQRNNNTTTNGDDDDTENNNDNHIDASSFLNPLSDGRVPLVYEATILLGMAACQAATTVTDPTDSTTSFLHLDGEQFFDTLVNKISFQGMSGLVTLDPSTGSRIANSTLFRLINMVEQDVVNEIDADNADNDVLHLLPVNSKLFTDGQWKILEPYIYNDATTQQPLDIPPPELEPNHIYPYIRGVAFVFCILAVGLAIYFIFWTWYKRNSRIVRASQPIFLFLVCLGNILLALTIVPMTFDDGNASSHGLVIACTSAVWLLAIGVGTIFSALFAKAHRINALMKSASRCRKITVSARDTLKPIVALLFLNILILSLMTGLDPIEFIINVVSVDSFGRETETYGTCGYATHHLQFTIPLVAINFGMLCAAAFQSWRTRNLSTEFQESQSIFRALWGILLVVFIGAPVLFIAQDNSNAYLFVSSAIIFVTCLLILLLIYVPKIQYETTTTAMRRGTTHISGLDFTTGLDGDSFHHPSGGHMGLPRSSFIDKTSFSSGRDDESVASDAGDRIFSAKTQHELATEVAALKKYIRVLKNRPQEGGLSTYHRVDHTGLSQKNPYDEDNDDINLRRPPVVQFAIPDRKEVDSDDDDDHDDEDLDSMQKTHQEDVKEAPKPSSATGSCGSSSEVLDIVIDDSDSVTSM
ncbi:7 transmembrane sweet-taste receptor of 3 GCPR [Nitzschia inconspicua]|uniref:7 transmembrane sweet-taste receptor of 3 GCPR n=1 Tax=Nitzschia inconspicua TaxID=303405 RepID=A0A9K3P7Q4_9STRA|nr:7 transmembrane sweet-taste receptor of 3 GCPR [Nitzschia inconspicua]KAG7343672.1 7 transmembrane sweet-taste receptor of 3 GCPR [Nitzschia inconspicua]